MVLSIRGEIAESKAALHTCQTRTQWVSKTITGFCKPIDLDNFIVKGSEKTGLYGANFRQTSTAPEEFTAYG